jgi:hypothetical protein
MARTTAALPPGSRLTDYISLGVLTASFPIATVGEVLLSTGCMGRRERSLPAATHREERHDRSRRAGAFMGA